MAGRSSGPLLLAYSIAFAAFLLIPPLLSSGRGLHPDMELADLVDLFTPLVLIPLSWHLFSTASPAQASRAQAISFLAVAALWGLGHGTHLAANSVGNLVAESAGTPDRVKGLVHFYDETLSHYLWHAGILGLAALTVWRAWNASREQAAPGFVLLSGGAYGFTLFLISTEGGSVLLVLPGAAILVAALLWRWRAQRPLHPTPAMFLAAHAFTLLLLVVWGLWHGGFPQFTELGWL